MERLNPKSIVAAPALAPHGLNGEGGGFPGVANSALIIFGAWEHELPAVKIIAAEFFALLQKAWVDFDARLKLKISEPNGIPDSEGPGTFEFQRQINGSGFAIPCGPAPHFVSLRAHN